MCSQAPAPAPAQFAQIYDRLDLHAKCSAFVSIQSPLTLASPVKIKDGSSQNPRPAQAGPTHCRREPSPKKQREACLTAEQRLMPPQKAGATQAELVILRRRPGIAKG